MCGISLLVRLRGHENLHEEIKVLNEQIIHRGPDDEGVYINKNVALGHRRLSIIDLSQGGHQPMIRENHVIIFNGEIYNYLEIKSFLVKKGYPFRSNSDTEVILAAYEHWGQECVNHFNGMWSFIIYDRIKNIIFGSRDRYGIKPFYYFTDGECFVGASEIKQIVRYKNLNQANEKILKDFLVFDYLEHSNETFFSGVYKLPPSHNIVIDCNTLKFDITKYYDLRSTLSNRETPSTIEEYLDALRASVKLRLRSDVKVGTCLSGGMDSSIIAAIAAPIFFAESGTKFSSITSDTVDEIYSEWEFANAVVNKSNLDSIVVKPSVSDIQKCFDELTDVQEEPFSSPSIIMQHFVMQAAKANGLKVLLDGQGGDETLLGYERYYVNYLREIPFLKSMSAFFQISRNSKLSIPQLLSYNLYFRDWRVRKYSTKKRFSFLHPNISIDYGMLKDSSNHSSILDLQIKELTKYQLPRLLRYEDKNSMFASIETRLPFLDYKVVEHAVNLNVNHKIKNGWSKWPLRKMGQEILPEKVVWRKNKLGFPAPTESIFSDRRLFHDTIKNSQLLNQYINFKKLNIDTLDNNILWRMFSIAQWENKFRIDQ